MSRLLATLAAFAISVSVAAAALLIHEPFDYSGGLVGQDGGTGFDAEAWSSSLSQDVASRTATLVPGLIFGTGSNFLETTGNALNLVVVNDDDGGGIAEWNRGLNASLGAGESLWMSFLFRTGSDMTATAGRAIITTINGTGTNLEFLPKRNGVAMPSARITNGPTSDLSGARATDGETYLFLIRFGLNTNGSTGSVTAWVLSETNFDSVAADGAVTEHELAALTNVHANAAVTNTLSADAQLDATDRFQFRVAPQDNNARVDIVYDELRLADTLADAVPLTTQRAGTMHGHVADAMARNDENSGLGVINADKTQIRAGRWDPDNGDPADSDSLNAAAVLVFQLPDLGRAAAPFDRASLWFRLLAIDGAPLYNVDLYGIQARTESTVLPEDCRFDLVDDLRAGMTKLQTSILVTNSAPGRFESDDMANWLNLQYAAGANAGKFVFLRLTPRADPSFLDVCNGYFVATADDPDAADRPVVTYTLSPEPEAEPGTVILISAAEGGATGLPHEESFETYAGGSSFHGSGGWTAESNSAAWAASSDYTATYGGTYPIVGTHEQHMLSVGTVAQTYAGTQVHSNLWIEMVLRAVPHEGELPVLASGGDAHVGCALNSNGYVTIGHGSDAGGGWGWTWTEVPAVAVGSNQFFRLTAQGRYAREGSGQASYRFWIDGEALTSPMTWFPAFSTNRIDVGRIAMHGTGTEVDDLVVSPTHTLNLHTVSVVHTEHGSVSPAGPVRVQHGGGRTFTLTPDTYYHVGHVEAAGEVLPPSSSVTVSNVISDTALSVAFEANRTFRDVPDWWLAEAHPAWSSNRIEWSVMDYDADGHATWMEYHAGTHPTNADSRFRLHAAVSDGLPEVSFDTVAVDPRDEDEGYRRLYSLECAASPASGDWFAVDSMTNLVGRGQREVCVFQRPLPDAQHYRGKAVVADPSVTNARPPNFILLLTDDQGWADAHFRGHPYMKTPNLDRLAREGTAFSQFYVNNPVCSPTRAAFMTGHYPARHRIHGHFTSDHSQNASRDIADYLDPAAMTVTKALKSQGYATAHFGKWHLGSTPDAPDPGAYGIDVHMTLASKGRQLYESAYYDQFDPAFVSAYRYNLTTHAMAYEAAEFLEANQAVPFYMNFWTLLPHATLNPTPDQLAEYSGLNVNTNDFPSWMRGYLADASGVNSKMRIFCASVTALDDAVGVLLDKLDELGLTGNTLIFFASDNGPEDYQIGNASNAGVGFPGRFRARKRSLYEGGVRTPCIVRWPGRVPVGVANETGVVSAVDWFPMVMRLAGLEMPTLSPPPDGEDISDVLCGSGRLRARPLMWEWRYTVKRPSIYQPPPLAIRDGEWKLFTKFDGSSPELYDVLQDPEERTSLAGQPEHTTRVAALTTQLMDWKATLP